MTVRTVGAAGDFAFSQAGLNAAIAACSTDDTVRIIDAGTITLTAEVSVGTRITIEGDPALLDLTDLTTLPKLYTALSIRAMDLDVAGISVKNLQLEGFPIGSAFGVGGAINAYGGSGVVGTFENLLFIDCVTALQECVGGTQRNIHAINCGRLVRDCYGLDMAIFSIVQAGGYNYAIDAQWDKWSRYRLGAIYQPNYNANDRAIRVLADAGQPGLIQNVSAYRAGGGAGGIAYTGDTSYCTAYGYATVVGGGGVDDGNNFSRDPLFTDPANGDFTWQAGSSDAGSGTSVAGVTEDAIGEPLPTGVGWPRGPYGLELSTTVDSITVVSSTSIKLNLLALVTSDATWEDAGNFTITESGGAVAVTVASAAITDAGMSITLTTSEHTNNGAYDVAWAGLTNVADGNDAYTGTSTPPVVSSATMTGGKVIRVTFSKSMTNNAALTTVGNYLISGMTVSGVVRVDATRVDVTMTERIPAANSTITVNGPQDTALNPVSNSAANFAVPYLTFVPGGTATDGGRALAVAFNLPPTGGVSATSDWTVTRSAVQGAVVTVTGVTMDGANAALTLHPGMTRGVAYTITAPGAVNGAGGLG